MNGRGPSRGTEPGLSPVPNGPSLSNPLTQQFGPLFALFEAAGYDLFLVGGGVRDLLMKLPPGTDFDFATSARPEQTRSLLRKAGFRTWDVGARFGTISTFVAQIPVEITTYRAGEVYSPGSRHPEVRFGDQIGDDLARRDLSINAMAMGSDGVIVDPFDGRGAIERRALEVPGGGLANSISILRDDPLRLLRIARFAARLDFEPTAETTEAATATAPELEQISRERWKMELDKLLLAPHAQVGLRWLHRTGALGVVLRPLRDLGDGRADALIRAVCATPRRWGPRWARLAIACADPYGSGSSADRNVAAAEQIVEELRGSVAERRLLATLAAPALRPDDVRTPWAPSRIRRLTGDLGPALDDALATTLGLVDDAQLGALSAEVDARQAELDAMRAQGDPTPRLPSGMGNAIMRDLGVRPGPEVKRALDRLRHAVIDGDLPNPPPIDEAVAWLRAQH